MSNALAQAARAGFRPVGENSMVQYGTAKQQAGECCSQILQLSDKNFTQSWLPVKLNMNTLYIVVVFGRLL